MGTTGGIEDDMIFFIYGNRCVCVCVRWNLSLSLYIYICYILLIYSHTQPRSRLQSTNCQPILDRISYRYSQKRICLHHILFRVFHVLSGVTGVERRDICCSNKQPTHPTCSELEFDVIYRQKEKRNIYIDILFYRIHYHYHQHH